jgi:hypothetical protein
MKKKFVLLSFLFPIVLVAQNVQIHYDFGKDRNYITTTFEMFKPDNWGNTFFFVDYDYNLDADKNVGSSYMEIARCFTLSKSIPLSAHVEYNGGLFGVENSVFPINNAFLAGLDYGWNDKDFTKFLNFKVLYKNIVGKNQASFQLTGVWDLSFYNKKLTLSGFADFWREDNDYFDTDGAVIPADKTRFVFMTEPQIWYNITSNLSIGSEIEVACNFNGIKGWKVCPTLGAKWNF